MTAPARLERVDGAAAGERIPLNRSFTLLGQHPAADIPFASSPTVSPRHAAIVRTARDWLVRDLNSTEGTWVNGTRIRAEVVLRPGDEIRLGPTGPVLRFDLEPGATTPPARFPSRLSLPALVLLTMAGLTVLALSARRLERRTAGLERLALLARVDSLAAALQAAQARSERLGQLLAAASTEAATARTALEETTGQRPSARLDSLAREVSALTTRQAPLLRAAAIDLEAIGRPNQDAIALVLAERRAGRVASGTGFAIRSVGDTSWIVTSRHVVVDTTSARSPRLGVVFNGSAQNFEATLVRVHPTADLALLRVLVRGGTPVVLGLADSLTAGEAVGTISFPGELDLAPGAAWHRDGVTARLFPATVSTVAPDRIQLDGYGAVGMSGSPLFTGKGRVAGVIFGGAVGSGGRVVFAVPLAALRELLEGT